MTEEEIVQIRGGLRKRICGAGFSADAANSVQIQVNTVGTVVVFFNSAPKQEAEALAELLKKWGYVT